MKPGDLIEETMRTLQGMEDQPMAVTSSLQDVMSRLMEQEGDIPLELPWEEVQNGERISRHQVVLIGLDADGGRVRFFNPAADVSHEPGHELGGPMHGPPRRAEEPGIESMAFEDFARYFAEGHAYALLREK